MWKPSGLFLISGYWGWLSTESLPQNTEFGVIQFWCLWSIFSLSNNNKCQGFSKFEYISHKKQETFSGLKNISRIRVMVPFTFVNFYRWRLCPGLRVSDWPWLREICIPCSWELLMVAHIIIPYNRYSPLLQSQRGWVLLLKLVNLGDNCILNFQLERYIVGYTIGNSVFTATREQGLNVFTQYSWEFSFIVWGNTILSHHEKASEIK